MSLAITSADSVTFAQNQFAHCYDAMAPSVDRMFSDDVPFTHDLEPYPSQGWEYSYTLAGAGPDHLNNLQGPQPDETRMVSHQQPTG